MSGPHHPAARLPSVRPLVIPTSPSTGTSLIGLVARATARNVLGTTSVILDEVGLTLHHPGTVGQNIGPHAGRLAEKIGCTREDVERRLHGYVDEAAPGVDHARTDQRAPVRWGSGSLERLHLELRRRRLSPSVLASSDEHRSEWMCVLLPFCTETLEPLVDGCARCGAGLGWTGARGIGVCEHCRRPVPASSRPRLDRLAADDYRRFAALISTDENVRLAAVSPLAEPLRSIAPTRLVRLVLGLGRALDPTPDPYNHGLIVDRNGGDVARIVARGRRLLDEWPTVLRESVRRLVQEGETPIPRPEMLSRLRRVGGYRAAGSAPDDLLSDALPGLFEHKHRALSFSGPTMLAAEASRLIGISISELRLLENAGALKGEDVGAGERLYRQYPGGRIDGIATAWRSSRRSNMLERHFGMPAYAVRQLVRMEEIVPSDDPAVQVLDDRLRVTAASADRLVRDLDEVCRRSDPPTDAIPLKTAAERSGSGEKAWGHALAQLRAGEIPCWRRPDVADPPPRNSSFASRTLVDPSDARTMFALEHRQEILSAARISQTDVCDILNIDFTQLRKILDSGALVFEASRQALLTNLGPVLDLARRTISASELSGLLNQNPSYTTKLLLRHPAIRRDVVGWRRADVIEHWWSLVEDIADARSARNRRRITPNYLSRDEADKAFRRLRASMPL